MQLLQSVELVTRLDVLTAEIVKDGELLGGIGIYKMDINQKKRFGKISFGTHSQKQRGRL